MKSEPRRKPEPHPERRGKECSDHTQEPSEHDERDKGNYRDIGKRRDDGDLSEVRHKDGESKYHRCEAHGERFPKSEPLGKECKESRK